MDFYDFPFILGIMIPFDFHIFQRGRLNHQPAKVSPIMRWTSPFWLVISSCKRCQHILSLLTLDWWSNYTQSWRLSPCVASEPSILFLGSNHISVDKILISVCNIRSRQPILIGEIRGTKPKPHIDSGWWFQTFFIFHNSIIYGIILPIDFHMFQDAWNHQPGLVAW